jgi:hypothetical protein
MAWRRADPPFKESCRLHIGLRNRKSGQGPTKDCRAAWGPQRTHWIPGSDGAWCRIYPSIVCGTSLVNWGTRQIFNSFFLCNTNMCTIFTANFRLVSSYIVHITEESKHKKENQLVCHTQRLKSYPHAIFGKAAPSPLIFYFYYDCLKLQLLHRIK